MLSAMDEIKFEDAQRKFVKANPSTAAQIDPRSPEFDKPLFGYVFDILFLPQVELVLGREEAFSDEEVLEMIELFKRNMPRLIDEQSGAG